jgi:hypothetical protein
MSFLMSVVVALAVGYAVGAFFHGQIVRTLRAEVATLRAEVASLQSTLPGRLIDLLVERGVIPRNREPLARSTVIERLLRRDYPHASIGQILGEGDGLPEGFAFLPPTDVSGKQVLGPADRPPEAPTERKDS